MAKKVKTWKEQPTEVIIANFGPIGKKGMENLLDVYGGVVFEISPLSITAGNNVREDVAKDLLNQLNRNNEEKKAIKDLNQSLKLLLDIAKIDKGVWKSYIENNCFCDMQEFVSFVNKINEIIINEFSASTEEVQRKRHILSEYYLKNKSLNKIAKEMGAVSLQRVKNIKDASLEKIRQYGYYGSAKALLKSADEISYKGIKQSLYGFDDFKTDKILQYLYDVKENNKKLPSILQVLIEISNPVLQEECLVPYKQIELVHMNWISTAIRKKLENVNVFNLSDLLKIDFKEFYKNNNITHKSYYKIYKYLNMFR